MTPYAWMFGAVAFVLLWAVVIRYAEDEPSGVWPYLLAFCIIACAVCTDLIDGRLFG